MSSAETWLSFSETTELVRTRTGASVGRAEALLQRAEESGEVRWITKIPKEAGECPYVFGDGLIVGADYDWHSDTRGEFGGFLPPRVQNGAGLIHTRHLNQDDLIDWLNRNVEPPPKRPTTRRPAKALIRAKAAAHALWGTAGPPAHLTPKLICRDVLDWLKKHDQGKVSDTTILRAVGRKDKKSKR